MEKKLGDTPSATLSIHLKCSFTPLGFRSHGLVIRSLDLHNSFSLIAICSINIPSRDLHNAIRENELC